MTGFGYNISGFGAFASRGVDATFLIIAGGGGLAPALAVHSLTD